MAHHINEGPSHRLQPRVHGAPLAYWGFSACFVGVAVYVGAVFVSILRLALGLGEPVRQWIALAIWYSGVPTTIGLLMVAADLLLFVPSKRRIERREDAEELDRPRVTVALTAYNDESSIFDAVRDFQAHPFVERVIVVSNNSRDETVARARAAGATVFDESRQGYGHCAYRCLEEAASQPDSNYIVLCEGDRTFRARDIDKLAAQSHRHRQRNSHRQQLRNLFDQLTTLICTGISLSAAARQTPRARHIYRRQDTYKLIRREHSSIFCRTGSACQSRVQRAFLDTARVDLLLVECPITFHLRWRARW
jgi:hypothetical protein